MKTPRESRADILQALVKSMGPYPGVETRDQPDELDVVDAGDVVEGESLLDWQRVRRV